MDNSEEIFIKPSVSQESEEGVLGTVFDIQRYSLGDGSGIRTTVFMKGCNLRCRWCQNPESFSPEPESAYRSDRCIKCGNCSGICPTKARYVIGRSYTVKDLLSEVMRDTVFFRESGGGVTLSGGEATLQFEFIYAFLKECRKAGLNTALETNGFTNRDKLTFLVPLLDRIYYDIKVFEPVEHRKLTGADNTIILENARWLVDIGAPISFRVPLIPGMTFTQGNLNDIAKFINLLGVKRVELCPYHNNWERKLFWLNTSQQPLGLPLLSPEDIEKAISVFEAYKIDAKTA